MIILASTILGGVFYASGMSKIIDDALGRRAPFYDRIINPRIDFWSQPGKGRLTGLIKAQISVDEYQLIDRNKEQWEVFTGNVLKNPEIGLEINRPARFLGKIQADHEFMVVEILPIMPPDAGFFNRFHSDPPPFRVEASGSLPSIY